MVRLAPNEATFSCQKNFLTTANLALRNRPDPSKHEIENNSDDTNNPDTARIVRSVVTENNGEDDTAQIARCSDETREDA